MSPRLRDVMTAAPTGLGPRTSLTEAARRMRDENIGDVLVMDGDRLAGVVTDRDIVVRAIADGRDPESTTLEQICSSDVVACSPDESVEDAVRMMREQAIRRVPVVENGRPIGIVSLGDLALEREPESVLANISAAPPQA